MVGARFFSRGCRVLTFEFMVKAEIRLVGTAKIKELVNLHGVSALSP